MGISHLATQVVENSRILQFHSNAVVVRVAEDYWQRLVRGVTGETLSPLDVDEPPTGGLLRGALRDLVAALERVDVGGDICDLDEYRATLWRAEQLLADTRPA